MGSVNSIQDDSTEEVIQKVIEGAQRMIRVNNNSQEEESEIRINPAMKRHFELEIKTLQNAPRDADKLRRLLEVKQRQKEEALHIEDTQRLVTEIEMLKVVLYLISRDNSSR
jgi:hypothetical protein